MCVCGGSLRVVHLVRLIEAKRALPLTSFWQDTAVEWSWIRQGDADKSTTRHLPFVLANQGLEIVGELRVAPNETPDLVQPERAHGKPDLEGAKLAPEGYLHERREGKGREEKLKLPTLEMAAPAAALFKVCCCCWLLSLC